MESNSKQYIIYIHINLINNKKYIGQTSRSLEARSGKEGQKYSNQSYFYKAIKKYGWNNFEHKIIEIVDTQEKADEREKYWIAFYQSNNSKYGYNQTKGGSFGSTSEEANQKRLQYWTEEKRLEQSNKLKERWATDIKYAQKMKEMASRLPKHDMSGEKNPMYGTHRTGKDATHKKKVQCIETGDIFDTIVEAARWSNNGKESIKAHISAVCKGKRNTSGHHPETGEPLHWKYVETITDESEELDCDECRI